MNGFVAKSADPEELGEAILRVHSAGPALRQSTADWFRRNRERLSLETLCRARARRLRTPLAACASASTSSTSSRARPAAVSCTRAGSSLHCSRRGPTCGWSCSQATRRRPALAAEPWASEVELVHLAVRSRSRPRRVLAEQTLLPRAARRARVDLLHNVQNTAPAMPGVPQVTTILDVIYKRHPETHAGVLAAGVALLVPLAARRSRRILTLSESAKDDIAHYLHVDRDRIDVTPLGPGLSDDVSPVAEAELRRRLELGDAPIVLTVSAKRPHKNLERLLEAIARVQSDPQPATRGSRVRDRLRARAQATRRRSSPVPRLGRRRRARRPVPHRDVLRLPIARGGIRPASARGDGARRSGRLLADRPAQGGRRRRRALLRPHGCRRHGESDRDPADRRRAARSA